MTPPEATGVGTSEMRSAMKEWRQPILRKLPISTTAGTEGKPASTSGSDGQTSPKTADASRYS